MNYRHIYHAGNGCDVVKHAAFALLLTYLKQKETPFAVLDTHAGCGLYDLQDPRAVKTGEAEAGIQKLWRSGKETEELAPYLSVLRAMNPGGSLRFYPGSPLLARRLMREGDRLVACELHPEDVNDLRRALRDEPAAHVHHRDGYEALKAFLPFSEKRGVVLIDPPFEALDEFEKMVAAVKLIQKRMPNAVAALWYPIKERPAIWRFHESLVGIPKVLVAEFLERPEVRADRLNGSGLVIINAPWKLDEALQKLFSALRETLQTEAQESRITAISSV